MHLKHAKNKTSTAYSMILAVVNHQMQSNSNKNEQTA